MRIRKKKHLEDRLNNIDSYLININTDIMNQNIANSIKEYISYKEIFNNDNPVHIEIGCGRGRFICDIAKRNPDINYIAVEKISNVIVTACENAAKYNLNNVRFMITSAEYLPRYIIPHSVGRIYLNFSCPYPKKTYANRRLTHKRFIEVYRELLNSEGDIHQKTDNMHFFEYSIEQYSSCGMNIRNVSLDLHNSDCKDNIVTEYEQKFADQGLPIYRLEAYIK